MSTTDNTTIKIDMTLYAPVNDVWRAWTEPDLVMRWFGSDPNGKGLKAVLDVRPGGYFEITFCNADGAEHTCSGLYKEILENIKLSFSWEWKSEPGVVSLVAIQLATADNATQMYFTHANVGTSSAHNYQQGWRDTFFKLEKVLGVMH